MNYKEARLQPVVAVTLIAAGAILLLLWILAAPLIGSSVSAGTIVYVDISSNQTGDGASWDTAYKYLQDALANASSGEEIWVAQGTYFPDNGQGINGGDNKKSFRLVNGVAVYGGFLGNETSLDQRDPWNYVTTLSGDIDQDDVTGPHGITYNASDIVGNNSFHVVTGGSTDSSAVLDGFAITAGQADGHPLNERDEGGGLYVRIGSPVLNNLLFAGNSGKEGGAMALVNGSSSALTNSWFSGNAASENGGALHNEGSSPTLTNVLFSGNAAEDGGGAIFNDASSPQLNNVTISANAAGVTMTLASLNMSAAGGGILNTAGSSPLIRNSVIWNNQDGSGSGTASSSINNQDGGSTPTAINSDIQGLASITGLVYDGTSIDTDPLLVAPADPATAPSFGGNYRIKGGSPAIDTGDDSFNSLPFDLARMPRIQGAFIDMGAYEAAPAPDISVHKSSDMTAAEVGDTVTYTYQLINTGGVTVTGVTANDDKLGVVDFGLTEMAPGMTATTNLTYTVLFTDIPGPIANTILVTGTVGVSTTVATTDTAVVSLSPFSGLLFLPIITHVEEPPPPTPTPSPTPTVTPIPPICQNIVENSDFEGKTDWVLPITAYSAEYSTAQKNSGAQSVRTGITAQGDNVFSYSSVRQKVTIPGDATKANLTYYLFPQTSETTTLHIPKEVLKINERDALTVSDLQLVLVLDSNYNEIGRLYADRRSDGTWIMEEHDLLAYKGQTIWLYFGTFNNGTYNQGVTAMFVDDVELEVCTP